MRYVILGGGGSFGLHTAKYLLDQPGTEHVMSIGRAPPKPPCFTMRVGEGSERYAYTPLHITYDIVSVLKLFDLIKPDVIINFAAQGEGATSFTSSWQYFETNCVGLSRLVEALIGKKWLQRFIHISTSEGYGSTDRPATEDFPATPTSPYAVSKIAFDQYLSLLGNRGFPATIVRPSNCYGEGQQLHRFIPKAFLFGMTGRKVPLHGGGKAEKSYIHSEDLARAIYLLRDKPLGIYNVGPTEPIAMIEVANMIAYRVAMLTSELFDVSAPDRAHQDARYWIDSTKIRMLGWHETINWDVGLDRVGNWVFDNLEELQNQPVDFVMRP